MTTFLNRARELMDAALDCPKDRSTSRRSRWWFSAIAASVCVISWLHYVTSYRSIELHELFQRLYYLPIVVAAVIYGAQGGLLIAGLSAVLFLPHVFLQWHAWPVFQIDQYAEVIVFTLVAGVTGLLADRLRAQRDRCQRTALELDETCHRLEASIEERVRTDRLLTIGRLASGVAHEIRNPLGGLLGSLEILGADVQRGDPKTEFLAIAKNQVERLNRVVNEFLDFAQPPPPAARTADIRPIVDAATRLATPTLALRGATADVDLPTAIPHAHVDIDQVERAVLNILLDETSGQRDACTKVTVDHTDRMARIILSRPAPASGPVRSLSDVFEPFPGPGTSSGSLALATAKRLIENQRGTVRAELSAGNLRYVIELPLAHDEGARETHRVAATGSPDHGW